MFGDFPAKNAYKYRIYMVLANPRHVSYEGEQRAAQVEPDLNCLISCLCVATASTCWLRPFFKGSSRAKVIPDSFDA